MQSQQTLARGVKTRPSRVNPDEIDELLALGSTPTRPVKAADVVEASAPPAAQVPSAPAFEVPAKLTGFFALYAQYELKVAALADELRQAERQLFGDDWQSVISTPKTDYLSSITQGLIDNLVAQAETRYAPEAGSLTIEPYDVLVATSQQRWQEEHARKDTDVEPPVDLDKIRAHLDETYGGDGGATAAYQQQAKVLIDFFGFNRDTQMVATSRYVGCSVRVYSSKKDYGPDKGKFELYNSHERVRKLFKALACAFAWAEQHELSCALQRTGLTHYNFTFRSRHRESFPGLEIILYSEKWDWQFNHDAANALKLFLGQYGA